MHVNRAFGSHQWILGLGVALPRYVPIEASLEHWNSKIRPIANVPNFE